MASWFGKKILFLGSFFAINNTTVEVTFKEEIEDIKALDFAIEGLTVSNASVKQTGGNKVVVLTTSEQVGDKAYTVTANGSKLGTFKGVSAVVPTAIKVTTASVQGVIGKEVTVSAQVTVAEGQSKAGIPVTFNIVSDNPNSNSKIEVEAFTNAEGVASYSYTRYYSHNDSVAAYATSKSSVVSSGKVYWASALQLTVKDITEATTLTNGSKKVYEINSAKNAGKYVFVAFEENLNVTPDKVTKGIKAEGVSTFTLGANGKITATTAAYPYEVTTGGKAVIAVLLDANGKANLVLTGDNAKATPIVYEGTLDAGLANVAANYTATYSSLALQTKASTVSFELKHNLGLTLEAQGVENAALSTTDGTGGRDYTVTFTDKDGKPVVEGTTVRVAIPKAGLNGTFALLNSAGNAVAATSDADNFYYNLKIEKKGQTTFTVTSTKENDYVSPVVFIENGASNGLDKNDLQTAGAITYFVKEVTYAAKLAIVDAAGKATTSFVAGKDSAFFRYVLVDQNGKARKADKATTVTFDVYAGSSPVTVNGQTVQADKYHTVSANIAAGANFASVKVDSAAATTATVTATGSLAGIVLPSTTPTSVTATFTQFATGNVTGEVVVSTVNKVNNTFALVDSNAKVHVYKYEDATLLQNNSAVSEQTFEALLDQGARVTVSKDDAGHLTFNVVATGVGTTLSAQQAVDVAIQLAVINGDASVTVQAVGGGNITVNTDAAINIVVEVNAVNNLTITGANTGNVNINKVGAGTVAGDLTVNTPKAHVTSNVTVSGNTDIKDVSNSSFVNNGLLSNVNISDANGSTFLNNGTVGVVTVSGPGAVAIGGTNTIAQVDVTGASAVTLVAGAKVTTVNVLNDNALVDNKSGNVTNVVDSSAVAPVTALEFTDSNAGTNIDGQITFTAATADSVSFDIAVNNVTVGTVARAASNDFVFNFATDSLKADDTITVTAKNATGKNSVAETVKVVNDETNTPGATLAKAQVELQELVDTVTLNIAHEDGKTVAVDDTIVIGGVTYTVLADATTVDNVATGTKFVTVADAKVLVDAIGVATVAKTATNATAATVTDAKGVLTTAISTTFVAAVKTGTQI